MKEDMVALAELIREMGEKYNAYISCFTFNGESSNLDYKTSNNIVGSEFVIKNKEAK